MTAEQKAEGILKALQIAMKNESWNPKTYNLLVKVEADMFNLIHTIKLERRGVK